MKYVLAFAFFAATSPVLADGHSGPGDAAAGEKAFRQCQSCHVVKDDTGETLAGKNGRTGPNLFGVIGREAGTLDGFKYRKSIKAAGEAGLVWNAENLAVYVQNPTAFLREFLDDSKAKSGMGFKVKKEEDAANLAAFLATFTTP